MATGSYRQAYVICPFYKMDDGRRKISCEGPIDDSRVSVTYGRRQDFESQITIFCCNNYKNCEIYRMVMASKYADEEELI